MHTTGTQHPINDWRDGSIARARQKAAVNFFNDTTQRDRAVPDSVYVANLTEHRLYREHLEHRAQFVNNCALLYAKIARTGRRHLTYVEFEAQR